MLMNKFDEYVIERNFLLERLLVNLSDKPLAHSIPVHNKHLPHVYAHNVS